MGKCVMTVDNSATIRKMVVLVLQDAGYKILEAGDGVEALNKVKNSGVNLVITDLNLPNMDGIELIRNLRNDPAHRSIPVIVLTTESRVGKRQEGRQAGATGWIVKPFYPDHLLTVVKMVLG